MTNVEEWQGRFQRLAEDFQNVTRLSPEAGQVSLEKLTARAGHLVWQAHEDGVIRLDEGVQVLCEKYANAAVNNSESAAKLVWWAFVICIADLNHKALTPNPMLEKGWLFKKLDPDAYFTRTLCYVDTCRMVADHLRPTVLVKKREICELFDNDIRTLEKRFNREKRPWIVVNGQQVEILESDLNETCPPDEDGRDGCQRLKKLRESRKK